MTAAGGGRASANDLPAWRLLLTRPAEECSALSVTLGEQGVFSSALPLLVIEPLAETAEQRATILDLDRYCAVIAVSKPAARLGLELLERYRPQPLAEQPWFSVGAATGQILADHGLRVFYPREGDDSEALLALPELAVALAVPSPRVLILRGEGGREALAERLRAQGVVVDYLALYRRHLPDHPPGSLLKRIEAERLNGLVVSSGQGFEHLRQLAAEAWPQVANLPLFVPSPRVAALARAAGAQLVVDCQGASAAALLSALRTHSPGRPSETKDGYVSETTSNDALPARDAPLPPPVAPVTPAVPVSRARGQGLAWLALLLALIGAALAAWSVWQMRNLDLQSRAQLGQLEAVRAQTQALNLREQALSTQLERLPSADELAERRRLLSDLQGDQQRLSQRLEGVLGASRQEWRLAEAEHLLRLASLRLSALQDIDSARALVQGADQILHDQDDPGAFAAREQLAKSLQALRSVEQPDRTGLFLQLGALRSQAAELSVLAPTFVATQDSVPVTDSRWARWWQQISSFVRIDFNADQNIRPLLAGQSLTQVRLALSLALEQAQWAVLNGETEVYRQSLAQAREVLDSHFNQDNGQSRALAERLAELAQTPVAVAVPDLAPALSALQAYLQRREAATPAAAAPQIEGGQP